MNENYIFIGVALIIIFFLVKFISKIFFKYILPLIIAGFILFYLYEQGILENFLKWKKLLLVTVFFLFSFSTISLYVHDFFIPKISFPICSIELRDDEYFLETRVYGFLISMGKNKNLLFANSLDESRPLNNNSNLWERSLNRTVELIFN